MGCKYSDIILFYQILFQPFTGVNCCTLYLVDIRNVHPLYYNEKRDPYDESLFVGAEGVEPPTTLYLLS